ncbi:hypothetical protein Cni_G28648 [Canna indica]|uniref:Uncharacterized protein n=1 Tax=Canna indica TaxID=4628 RepID=A0AAQ3QSI5_9LILI|nr:hypothetical protein Cni_G28648 [Canna indica]
MLTAGDGSQWWPTPLPPLSRRATLFRVPPRRRKMAVVRLGSRRGWRWRGRRVLAGLLRRMRLRWLAAKYRAALKRLRACQATLVKDLIDGAASMEVVHSRLMMESYFAAGPFLPVAAVNCRSALYFARS